MERKIKLTENILEISGINSNPFSRYVDKIPLNDIIDKLIIQREKCEKLGYTNLCLVINQKMGFIDITIQGEIERDDLKISRILFSEN